MWKKKARKENWKNFCCCCYFEATLLFCVNMCVGVLCVEKWYVRWLKYYLLLFSPLKKIYHLVKRFSYSFIHRHLLLRQVECERKCSGDLQEWVLVRKVLFGGVIIWMRLQSGLKFSSSGLPHPLLLNLSNDYFPESQFLASIPCFAWVVFRLNLIRNVSLSPPFEPIEFQ